MTEKVIRLFIFFVVASLMTSCKFNYKKSENFAEIIDGQDSVVGIKKLNLIKKLSFEDFGAGKFEKNKIKVNYRLLKPKTLDSQKKYPLILVFHGSGAIGTNNSSQMGVLSKMWLLAENREKHPVFVLSPQFPVRSADYHLDQKRNVQVSESNEYLDIVLNSVDSLSKNENIDAGRIYIMGFSMGGATVMNAVSKRPDLFAAAINVSGIADFSNLNGLKDLPLWIIHGGLDSDKRPESNRLFYDEMKGYGNVKFWNYKNRYHNNILSNEPVSSIPEWLFKFKKNKINEK